ncbi:MAG: threonine synthase [Sulfuricurvum sp.]
MDFVCTRGYDGDEEKRVSFSEAILSPIASFGGLYVPEFLPTISSEFLLSHIDSSYKDLAYDLLKLFDLDVSSVTIKEALDLYDKFDTPTNPVPVVKVKEDLFISELYHGPTRAFKDMALQPFGVVLSSIAKKRGENYLILAATSGDTGPAALETFKNRANIKVACLYPDGGTSDVQRLQMVTEDAKNVKVIGINGVFDDAQSALKRLLASSEFKEALQKSDIKLSAANSVNFGRIIFQIIYHVHSYLELVRQKAIKMGERVYLNVPSGNFGNALGAYYAWKMGLFVEKIIISSNENNVLTKLIKTGQYDLREAEVVNTTSPAMDILKSSNIERVLYDLFGADRTKQLMMQLEDEDYYELSESELAKLREFFDADYCTDSEGKRFIHDTFYDDGYLMDPHTATCLKSYKTCSKEGVKTIAYSTAEWTKFSPVIANALTGESGSRDLDALSSISNQAKLEIPPMIKGLFAKEIVQKTIIDKEKIEDEILAFIS